MNTTHTAIPWECEYNGPPYRIYHIEGGLNAQIAYVDGVTQHGDIAKANAAYIVRCCNSHEALCDALRNVLTRLDLEPVEAVFPCSAMRESIRQALKLAEEGE